MEQQHRIFRLTIDLSLPSDVEPSPVQDRISSLLKTSLYQKINRVFSEYDDSKWNVKLDQLQLDLGSIEINRLETDFPNQVEKEFRNSLLKIKQTTPADQNIKQKKSALSSPLETLEFYLEKGSFPWWMPKELSKEPIQLFQQIVQSDTIKLKSVIAKVIGLEWPRKRIVNSFGEKEIKQIVHLLNPINSEIIVAYHEKLAKQHEKKPILKVGRKEFRKVGWEVILKYLFEERGSEFNQRNFLKQILNDLAVKFNITYKYLIESLEAIATYFNASDQKEASLLKNIFLLAQEEKSNYKNVTSLGISAETYRLSKGFSDQQLQQSLSLLQFVDGQKKQWIPKEQNIETSIILLKRLWEKDQNKALKMVQQLVLHDDNERFLSHLNKDVIQSMLAILQPNLHLEFLNIKKDLITLVQRQIITSWFPQALENMIYQHYFSFSIFSSNKWSDVKIILQPLLKKIAEKSEFSYPKFIKHLLVSISQTSAQFYLHSSLVTYLYSFLHQEKIDILQALNSFHKKKKNNVITFFRNWKFDHHHESINEYLGRIKKWMQQKEKHSSVNTIFKKPNQAEQWIKILLKTWSSSEKLAFSKILWPGISNFIYDWLEDLRLLLQHFEEKQLSKIPEKSAIELSLWTLLIKSGSSGKNRIGIINAHLNVLATELTISKSKLFNTIYYLAEQHATALKLNTILSKLIKEAIHKNLFVTFDPDVNFQIKKRPIVINDMEAITQYFKTGLLPLGKTIITIRSIILEHLKNNPTQLKFWLDETIQDKESLNRLSLFFSDSTTVDLMNILQPNAGTYALGILEMIQHLDDHFSKNFEGVLGKEYWKRGWEVLIKNQHQGFNARLYILSILQQVASQNGVNEFVLLEKLQKNISTTKNDSHQLIKTVIRVAHRLSVTEDKPLTTQQHQKVSEYLDFSIMTIKELIHWINHFLANSSVSETPSDFSSSKIIDFGKHIAKLNETEKKNFWKFLSDANTAQFFKQMVTPDEFNKIMDVAEVVSEVDRINKKDSTIKLFPFELSTLLLTVILTNRGSISNQKSFIHKILKDWANARNLVYQNLMEMLWPVVWQLAPVFHHHASFKVFSEVMKEELSPAFLEKKLAPITLSKAEETPKIPEEKPYRKLGTSDEELLEMDEVWVIQNAGLALLWPYFNILFERAGLMEESKFIDQEAQQKGALLLEYLASGNTSPAEHELVFNKILCGIPVASPIVTTLAIDDNLKELCEGLLNAAISHWEIIGETSIPSFRESFLIREGNLGITAKFWHLKVTSKAYDVLLRQLPWSIANISLSWVDLRLKVVWD